MMDLSEIEEKVKSLREITGLTPFEALSMVNGTVGAINKVVEHQVEKGNYETLEKLYKMAADAYLLAAEKVPKESRDRVAFPANYWSMRARQERLNLEKLSTPWIEVAPISKPQTSPFSSDGFFNDLIKEIVRVIGLSSTEKKSLREKPSKSCFIGNVTDLSGQIGLDEGVIKSYFKAIEQDSVLEEKLGRDNYDRVIGRVYDVELVGAIFFDLQDSIEKSETEGAVKKGFFETVKRSAEKNSLDNFIRCDDKLTLLNGVLQKLVEGKDAFKFVVSLIRSRVGIPHYESTIFSFDMMRYMLNHNEIESRIDKNTVEEILSDDLELLITELKLRDVMFNTFKNIANLFDQKAVNKEDAHKLIMRVLEMYGNALNITRLRFS
jgi:hypothetical protein